MSFISLDQKLLLLAIIIINIIFFLISIYMIQKNQKKINFLHPGWIIVICWFLYSQITPMYLLYAHITSTTNSALIRNFDFQTFLYVYFIYFFFLMVLIASDSLINLTFNYSDNEGMRNFFINSIERKSLLITGLILQIIGFYLYFKMHNKLANMDANLIYDKTRRINEGALESAVSFTNVYMIAFLFLFPVLLTTRFKSIKIILSMLFVVSSVLIIQMGTTLQVLLMLIAFLCFVYSLKRNTFINYIKISIIVLPLFFMIVQFSEAYRIYKLGLSPSISFNEMLNFSTFESVTGYISGLVVLKNDYVIQNYNVVDFILNILPNFIRDFMGISHNTVTSLIDESPLLSSVGTYVPTLPISMISYWVYAPFIFIFIYYLIYFIMFMLNRLKVIGVIVSTLLFIDLFYMFRLNIESWIGKFRLDFMFLSGAICIFFIIKIILTNKNKQRDD